MPGDSLPPPSTRGTDRAIAATQSRETPAIRANARRQPTTPPSAVAAGTPTRLATVKPRNSRPTADARRRGPLSPPATREATPKKAPCGSPDRNRAASSVPNPGAAAARPLPTAYSVMNSRSRVRRGQADARRGEQRRTDDHPDRVGGHDVAGGGDRDGQVGGDLGQQAHHRELRQPDREGPDRHG